ncbi:hypothetical protein HK097_008125 [Rhizophlyctis rosea]|uniref:Heterokaryon incompatibility domain-containing protein n=1 Tax=Rhizophlyctis rosea TaxID=64517 RepID=A0AAD5SJ02_9FUNG|nr:hypothetical protein HK097_008125 [Rhizophlyctis rosea]
MLGSKSSSMLQQCSEVFRSLSTAKLPEPLIVTDELTGDVTLAEHLQCSWVKEALQHIQKELHNTPTIPTDTLIADAKSRQSKWSQCLRVKSPKYLLNAHTIEVIETQHSNPPPYLALSYSWGDCPHMGDGHPMRGHCARLAACTIARLLNFSYLWIDEMCLGHLAHDQLTQEISNVAGIYMGAAGTIVFAPPRIHESDDVMRFSTCLANSTWASRLWTLQEGMATTNAIICCSEGVFYKAGETFYGTDSYDFDFACSAENFGYVRSGADFHLGDILNTSSSRAVTLERDRVWAVVGLFGRAPDGYEVDDDPVEVLAQLTVLAAKLNPAFGPHLSIGRRITKQQSAWNKLREKSKRLRNTSWLRFDTAEILYTARVMGNGAMQEAIVDIETGGLRLPSWTLLPYESTLTVQRRRPWWSSARDAQIESILKVVGSGSVGRTEVDTNKAPDWSYLHDDASNSTTLFGEIWLDEGSHTSHYDKASEKWFSPYTSPSIQYHTIALGYVGGGNHTRIGLLVRHVADNTYTRIGVFTESKTNNPHLRLALHVTTHSHCSDQCATLQSLEKAKAGSRAPDTQQKGDSTLEGMKRVDEIWLVDNSRRDEDLSGETIIVA